MHTPLAQLPDKIKEHWAPKKESTVGDADVNAIHLQVGIAAHTWETLDLALSGLFAQFVRGSYLAAQRVFGTMVTSPRKSRR